MMTKQLTSVHLKWLAIITMTIDHFGVIVLAPYQQSPAIGTLYIIARLIGRIAFPLFAFMIVEGVIKTKHPLRYLLRLMIMTITIAVAMAVLQAMNMSLLAGNIFIDLTMAALTMTAFIQKPFWQKALGVLPLGYYWYASQTPSLPAYLRPDYGLYGLILFGVFFGALVVLPSWRRRRLRAKDINLADPYLLPESPYQIASHAFMFLHILWYIIYVVSLSVLPGQPAIVLWLGRYAGAQSYALLSGLILLFYHGEKGKAQRWFQLFSYLYYPLHFVGLYGIYLLTTWF
jgi:hypothetical protein